MGKVTRLFCWRQDFVHKRLSARALGIYTCGEKNKKMCLKLEFKEICLELAKMVKSDKGFLLTSKVCPQEVFCPCPGAIYEGWSKSLFLFLIQKKIQILSKFCDVHIEIKYISSNWMLFENQLWCHSLWHMTSRDIPEGVIIVNHFSCVASAEFEIIFRSKKHSIPLRNAHPKLIATNPNTI